jgi:hypothetical protein
MCNGLECGVPVQLTAMVEQKVFGGNRLLGDRANDLGRGDRSNSNLRNTSIQNKTSY